MPKTKRTTLDDIAGMIKRGLMPLMQGLTGWKADSIELKTGSMRSRSDSTAMR